MRLPALVRRRSVWLPTLWGWLLLLLVVAVPCVLLGRRLHAFLSPNEPVAGARLLVVEGWLDPEDLDQAVAAFREGGYERVVTTGAPITGWEEQFVRTTFADLAAGYLRKHGIPQDRVTAVPAPESAQDRTYLSAVMVREWAERSGLALREFDVFSRGPHARRTWLAYRLAFGSDVAVGIRSAVPSDYDAQRWWTTSAGAKGVLDEALSLTWTKLFFTPPPRGSHEERWAVPRTSGVK